MTVGARRRRHGAWCATLAAGAATAALAPASTLAQVTLSLDVGGATVAYNDFLRSVVGTVTPSVLLERGRATFLARGAYSRFESGTESIQGVIAGSVLSPAVWKLRGEIGGSAATTQYRGTSAATNVVGGGRLHVAESDRGLWLGANVGGVAQRFLFPDDLVQLETGGWFRANDAVVTLQFTPTRVGEAEYVDAVAGVRWLAPRGELSVSTGYRNGDVGDGVNRWAEVGFTAWVKRRVAFVGGAGVFPAEIVRGLPGGRYLSVAMRVASRPPTGSNPDLVARLLLPYELRGLRRSGEAAERFVVATESDGTRTLRVRVPGARRVELMADFTDWTPVPLARGPGDTWVVNVFLAPGVHRVNLRVDGGAWAPPPGLTAVRDEFGGEVGLLVVQ